jgi:sugar phosphate isomerase/epimerase
MPADTPIDEHIHDRHRHYFCGFGLGRVDWPAWARLLRDRGYEGWAILELDAAPDPVRDIASGLTLVRQALLPIYRQ